MPEINLSNEEILSILKCVRCETIENLGVYLHKGIIKRDIRQNRTTVQWPAIHWRGKFPACKECIIKMKKWNRMQKIIPVLAYIAAIPVPFSLIIIAMILTVPFLREDPASLEILHNGIVALVIGVSLLVILGIVGKLYNTYKNTNNPSLYMDATTNFAKVKPPSSNDWMYFSEWADKVIKERILKGEIEPSLVKKLNEARKIP